MSENLSNETTVLPTAVDEAMRLLHFVVRHFGSPDESTESTLASTRISHLRLKLNSPELGSVELELHGKTEMAATAPITPAPRNFEAKFFAATQATLLCQPANETAAKILRTCDDVFDANKDDCNHFLKAAIAPYFGEIFDGLDADGIITALNNSANGWVSTRSISDTIGNAQNGLFVIAGMTSAELDQDHGHIAVVVGCPGALSGNVTIPVGYAGSIGGASSQIRGARLSGSFPASAVRASRVSYFSKTPTQ